MMSLRIQKKEARPRPYAPAAENKEKTSLRDKEKMIDENTEGYEWMENKSRRDLSILYSNYLLLISYLLTDDASSKHQPKVNLWLSCNNSSKGRNDLTSTPPFL